MDRQNKMTMDKKLADQKALKDHDRMVEKAQLKYYPYDGADSYQARANEWKEKLGIN